MTQTLPLDDPTNHVVAGAGGAHRGDGEPTHSWYRPTRLAVVALVACAAVGAGLALAPTFPASIRIPLGEAVANSIDWFIANCAWFYQPLADQLEVTFAWILYALSILPALTLATVLVVVVWYSAGVWLAALTTVAIGLAVSFGLWESTKETLALMAVAIVISCLLGIAVGIVGGTSRRLEAPVRLLLDALQTYPMFAYLVPALVIFGAGNAAALVVTIIWATPPVARLTIVGIRGVPETIVEAAVSTGATRARIMWDVVLPLARPTIRAGINQTVMFAITMAVISSMIGAAGLGDPVWARLRLLQFGQALEAGIILVLIAIIADRALAGSATRDGTVSAAGSPPRWPRRLTMAATATAASLVVSLAIPTLNAAFDNPPASLQLSIAPAVDTAVDWMNTNLGFALDSFRDLIQAAAINPVTGLLVWLPWLSTLLLAALMGFLAGGVRGAGLTALGLAGAGALGMWEPAMYTLGFVAVAVAISLIVGIPIGIACASSNRVAALVRPILDTAQTLPVFLFVIPAVVLLGPGPVAGLLATIAFAVPPVIRLTNVALREANPEIVEAATSFGATNWQVLRQVRIVVGMPTIMVGLNQAVMLALSMAVVSAFIGTPGLGREILLSLADANVALGVGAGCAMLLIAVTTDRLLRGAMQQITRTSHLAAT